MFVLSTAVGPLSMAVAQAASERETYTVKPGDTLMSIARSLLGDGSRWREIYDLNTDALTDPGRIYPGQVLRLGSGPSSTAAAPVAPEASADRASEYRTPERRPIRPPVVIDEPEPQDPAPNDSLFARRRGIDAATALRTYREQPYRPLRAGEFYSAGFLSEGDDLPYGTLLGGVTPQQIRNLSERATISLHHTVAVLPPDGATYQVGDSLLIVQVMPGPPGFGDVVYPTGMARVTGTNGPQTIALVTSMYATIRNGHRVLPAERFVDGGTSRARPVDDGVTGTVLGQRDTRELKLPQSVLYIDVGREQGVARGDLFEIRRDAAPRAGASDTIDELMAVLQVVHVRDRSATVKVLNVVSPDIPPGTRVRQVAKLPT